MLALQEVVYISTRPSCSPRDGQPVALEGGHQVLQAPCSAAREDVQAQTCTDTSTVQVALNP